MACHLCPEDELFELIPEQEHVLVARTKIMMYLRAELGTDARIGWSIWTGRSSVSQRGTPRLKASNRYWREALCDQDQPPAKSYLEVVPQPRDSAPFSDADRAATIATRERLYSMVDSYHLSGLHQARGTITHESSTGRLQYVLLRQLVYRFDGQIREMIAAEVLMRREDVSIDLHPVYSIPLSDAYLASWVSNALRRRNTHQEETHIEYKLLELDQDQIKHDSQRKRRVPKGFRCSFCNCTETPEARWGPMGKATLCNRCGIRWAKARRDSPQGLTLAVAC